MTMTVKQSPGSAHWARRAYLPFAATFALAAAYPISGGPVSYAAARGWLSPVVTYHLYLVPLQSLIWTKSVKKTAYGRYLNWWYKRGCDHAGKPYYELKEEV